MDSTSLTGRGASNLIERGYRSARQLEFGGREVLAQMFERRGAGNKQNIGRALQQPGKRHLHWRCAERLGDIRERSRLQRREAAEGEERDIGNGGAGKPIDERVVFSMGKIVV